MNASGLLGVKSFHVPSHLQYRTEVEIIQVMSNMNLPHCQNYFLYIFSSTVV